jgi:hypothetical protein
MIFFRDRRFVPSIELVKFTYSQLLLYKREAYLMVSKIRSLRFLINLIVFSLYVIYSFTLLGSGFLEKSE